MIESAEARVEKLEVALRALVEAAQGFIDTIDVINSGQTVIPFGQEGATFDAAEDRLRADLVQARAALADAP